MTEWNERVAVITGGASGIGLGMARAFGARGMKLVLADLDEALQLARQGRLTAAHCAALMRTERADADDECERPHLEAGVGLLQRALHGLLWGGLVWAAGGKK